MCSWGNTTSVRVKIPEDLSHLGRVYWKKVEIDSCIVSLVRALQSAGIDMRASCCGHGKERGRIDLQDGLVLFIQREGEL